MYTRLSRETEPIAYTHTHTHTHTERKRETEIYFKELAYANLGAGKSEICRASQ